MKLARKTLRRFFSKIEVSPGGCWLWTSDTSREGYGRFRFDGRYGLAHRVAFEMLVGPIPKPTLDHLCRIRNCVNPAHLEPTTLRENCLAPGSKCFIKTNSERKACSRCGGQFTETKQGRRRCRNCERGAYKSDRKETRAYWRERYALHREEINRRKRERREGRASA